MRVRYVFDFDDAEREQIAIYLHREFGHPPRQLATREQCITFIEIGLAEANGAAAVSASDADDERLRRENAD